jgi:hypothetical protein
MQFKTHDKLSIDFNNIEFNSVNSPSSNKPLVIKKSINGVTFYSSSIYMIDSIMKSNIQVTNLDQSRNWNSGDTSLFCKDTNNNYYICINNVLNNIFNDNPTNYDIIINDRNDEYVLIVNKGSEPIYFYRIDFYPFNSLLSKDIANFGKTMNITYYKTLRTETSNRTIHLYVDIENIDDNLPN